MDPWRSDQSLELRIKRSQVRSPVDEAYGGENGIRQKWNDGMTEPECDGTGMRRNGKRIPVLPFRHSVFGVLSVPDENC